MIPDPPGLVLELVEGESLATALARGRFAPREALAILLPVLDAVGFAHAREVVHRDLKPDNILLRRTERGLVPMVSDFGIAKLRNGLSATRTRAALGTPADMSPEQVRSPKAVDHRTDIFALGAILYELLTGRQAFEGETDFGIQQKIVEGRFEAPETLVSGLPPQLCDVSRRALDTNPEARFQSCAEMAAALQAAAAGR